MKQPVFLLHAVLVLALAAPPAWSAASDVGNPAPTFEQLDTNHDGYIDSSEADALPGLIGTFDTADRDKDGRLDRGEFDQAKKLISPCRSCTFPDQTRSP
ncbi:MAG TPA: hypothetical protein VKG21_13645 [Casimicrobiaceae bacterium]|nr:hypothetical protein [Casimicrobiaceae bacterium]